MYHSKKIGVFISHIMGDYQRNVCQGIIDEAAEYGYSTEIFASMDGENLGDYTNGEFGIRNIPNYEDFCGVIFASDTYPCTELKALIYETLEKKCTCPVVEIAVTNAHFPSVSLDNNYTTKELTNHLITAHSCKRICYLGSSEETYFSDAREKFYKDEMLSHGLSVGEKDIFLASYSKASVTAALHFFLSDGKKPDAIVCYNDRLALLFMEAAFYAGFQIPFDFAVTGCDDTNDGQNALPALTTVSFPVYELGRTASEKLVQILKDEEATHSSRVTAKVCFRSSCGCHAEKETNPLFFQQELSSHIGSLESSILTSMRMSAAFQSITDIDDGMDLLENYVKNLDHVKEFYVCLYSDWDSVSHHILELTNSTEISSSDEMLLKLAIRDGKRLAECSFQRNTLLPEHIYRYSGASYLYTPLFFQDKLFGYIALAYENNQINYHFQMVHWFMNINQMLKRSSDVRRTSMLVSHLEDIYTKDSLTGLYNKHGYHLYEKQLLETAIEENDTITCFFFDLDGLKKINDSYGHSEGDFAIQVIGHALSSVIRPGDICARFSGDEFYLLTKGYREDDAKDLITRVYKYLANYNNLSNKAYRISASGGFAQAVAEKGFSTENLDELFSQADKNMYEEKKEHHKQM